MVVPHSLCFFFPSNSLPTSPLLFFLSIASTGFKFNSTSASPMLCSRAQSHTSYYPVTFCDHPDGL